jgi:hypothetical protein
MNFSKTQLHLTPDNLKKRDALFLGSIDNSDYYFATCTISTFMGFHKLEPFIIKASGIGIKNIYYYSFNDVSPNKTICFLINKMRKLTILK